MKELLKDFIDKTVRIYTISGVESYLYVLKVVEEDYVAIEGFFKKEKTYLATKYIESFTYLLLPPTGIYDVDPRTTFL
jgi:hypothetical protein